jgi:tetratricopeptide (TPR) repeat protein
MIAWKKILAATAACLSLAAGGVAVAHDGPEHEIDELTARIKDEGESADLLLQRAIEYSVLSKTTEAVKDLERALQLEPHSAIVQRELSRTYFAAAKTNEAYDTASRALKDAREGEEHASILMVRSEISRAKKDFPKALDDTERAIRENPEPCEWYLYRSQLQQQLGLKKERIQGLEAGVKETGSGLLEGELIDALIDGGKGESALEKIEAELKDSRLQSTWLLRRAKVRLAMKKKDEAKSDLEAALKELNERLGRGASDPLALVDRGQVYELLGNKEEAKKDYESAQHKGIHNEWLHERLKVVKGEDKKKDDKKKSGDKKEEPKAEEKKADEADDKTDGDDQK